jgi:hypothetical protein
MGTTIGFKRCEILAHSPFNLVNPRRTVPELERVCDEVIDGRATLKELLAAGAAAAGVRMGSSCCTSGSYLQADYGGPPGSQAARCGPG